LKYVALIFLAVACLAACDDHGSPVALQHRSPTHTATPATASSPVLDPAVSTPPLSVDLALPPVAAPPVTLASLCAPIASATCRVHLACRTGVSREAVLACESHMRAACEAERPRLEARIAGERLRYDEAALRECVAHLDLLACGTPGEMQAALGAACDAVLVGRLGRGVACEDAGDCAPGLACMTASAAAADDTAGASKAGICPGTCEPLGRVGEHCDAELAPCAAGLSCEIGRCAAAQVALAEPCVTTAQCPANAFCEDLERGAVCVPRLATGKACDDDEQCAATDYCHILTLGDELALEVGTCAPRLAFGARCDPLVGGCADGLACDEASEVCARTPDSAGEGCVADVAPCGAGTGLVCDAGLCELEPFVGDACDPSAGAAQCRFGYCASDLGASGVGQCAAFLTPGSTCLADAECGALACVAGRCDRPASRCVASLHDINLGFRYRIR